MIAEFEKAMHWIRRHCASFLERRQRSVLCVRSLCSNLDLRLCRYGRSDVIFMSWTTRAIWSVLFCSLFCQRCNSTFYQADCANLATVGALLHFRRPDVSVRDELSEFCSLPFSCFVCVPFRPSPFLFISIVSWRPEA